MSNSLQAFCLIFASALLVAGEACSIMLWLQPSNTALWWMSIEFFGPLRQIVTHFAPEPVLARPLLMAPLLAVLVIGVWHVRRWPLGLATVSNAAFAASLVALAAGPGLSKAGPGLVLLVASLALAFLASHLGYWQRIAAASAR
jgi:hypothetical protein